jgi:hypothetical protein
MSQPAPEPLSTPAPAPSPVNPASATSTPSNYLFNLNYLVPVPAPNKGTQQRNAQIVALTLDEALAKFRKTNSDDIQSINRGSTVTV